VITFPVQAGKSDSEVKQISEYFSDHPAEYRESRKNAGIELERAYLQKTPMGNFVVAFEEGQRGFGETMAAITDQKFEANRKFVGLVNQIHGIDLTQPLPGPPPETIGDWRDERVSGYKKGMAFSAPLLPGKAEAGKAFIMEAFLGRKADFVASRRELKQTAEVVTLQQTPMGDIVAVYLEGEDPFEGNRKFAASSAPFDRWFKDELKKLVPPEIDFDQPVPGITEIFDSTKHLVKA
jgi:hypothetical protein